MTRNLTLLPFVFLLFTTLASCDTAEERAEKHFQSALELIEAGDIERGGR